MAAYKVTLKKDDADEGVTFEVPDGENMLDAAEDLGVDEDYLLYSCRAGSCSTCAGKIISGTVNDENDNFLDDEQKGEGFVLTCVAEPTSDCVILIGQEDNL
ncbi:MAG: 2Fe-2S iron-sulfur cluster-binding protein [Leptolyngbyaceae cyanobacterium]